MEGDALERLLAGADSAQHARALGRVKGVVGLAITAHLPLSRVGQIARIHRCTGGPLLAEVVGFKEHCVTLLPLGDVEGLGHNDAIELLDAPLTMRCGPALLGRVIGGIGQTIDGEQPLGGVERALKRPALSPFDRTALHRPLATGVRAIDGFCTFGEGQRVGLFSGAGVGKSSLLWQIARNTTADVVVLCLLGERGRELGELLANQDAEARRKTVVVCATAEQPALVRLKAALTATTAAEHFADQGKRVLLLVDSLTRFARAAREVGLAAGEAPVRRGYPPSVFAALPPLLERCGARPGPGRTATGSITGVYSVLVEGDNLEDPIADELQGLLDGHIVLDRQLAASAQHPAVDVPRSLSRFMTKVTDRAHQAAADRIRDLLAHYETRRDLVSLGAHRKGADPKLDRALAHLDSVRAFLRQDPGDVSLLSQTIDRLKLLAAAAAEDTAAH